MRPKSLEDLSDLLQTEQFKFRIDPATGAPIEPEPGIGGVSDLPRRAGGGTDGVWHPGDPANHIPAEPWMIHAAGRSFDAGDIGETGYYGHRAMTRICSGAVRSAQIPLDPQEWIQTYPNANGYVPANTARMQTLGGSPSFEGDTFTIYDGNPANQPAVNVSSSTISRPAATAAQGNTRIAYREDYTFTMMASAIAQNQHRAVALT